MLQQSLQAFDFIFLPDNKSNEKTKTNNVSPSLSILHTPVGPSEAKLFLWRP